EAAPIATPRHAIATTSTSGRWRRLTTATAGMETTATRVTIALSLRVGLTDCTYDLRVDPTILAWRSRPAANRRPSQTRWRGELKPAGGRAPAGGRRSGSWGRSTGGWTRRW